jgi:hypothetical protein
MDGLRGVEGVAPILSFKPEKYLYQMFGISVEKEMT